MSDGTVARARFRATNEGSELNGPLLTHREPWTRAPVLDFPLHHGSGRPGGRPDQALAMKTPGMPPMSIACAPRLHSPGP